MLGTGIMGTPIARNLAAAGFELTAWNRSREKAEPFANDGVTVADSPAEAVAEADAAITMLADADAVREVIDQATDGLQSHAIWIQASTVGLAATDELAGLAERNGVGFVDSPVLGTKQPAEKGELIVVASGPAELREPCAPVFDAIASRTLWLGEAGAGTRMKLVLNSWVLALTAGLAEAIALAEGLGRDPATFLEIIDGAPMGSPYAQLKGKAMIADELVPSFPLRLAAKDAALVLDAASATELEPSVAASVEQSFRDAAEAGHGDKDMASVVHAARGS